MIVIIQGTDSDSSYKKFSQLLSSYKDHRTIQFDHYTSKEDLNQAFISQDLFDDKKVIVLKNLLKKDKNIISILENAPKELAVICWESDDLTPSIVAKLSKFAKVENFKLPATIFYFLDNIAPGEKKVIGELNKLGEETSLTWNIQNRFLLLTLAKLKIDMSLAGKIVKRPLADWQWSKIARQAEKFTLEQLKSIYHASLKIDYLIKSGQTSLPPTTLLSVMLLKYL